MLELLLRVGSSLSNISHLSPSPSNHGGSIIITVLLPTASAHKGLLQQDHIAQKHARPSKQAQSLQCTAVKRHGHKKM